jgi:hypothetical protein
MIWMTDHQIELARHALGLDGRHKQSHRNYFALYPGSTDFDVWTQMVADGNATTRPCEVNDHPSPTGERMVYFHVTPEAAFSVLRAGEKLRDEELRRLQEDA